MTLDYTKMFLIVTEEAVVKGHFARGSPRGQCVTCCIPQIAALCRSTPNVPPGWALFFCPFPVEAGKGHLLFFMVRFIRHIAAAQFLHGALKRVPGVLPVCGSVAVIIHGDQPIQITLHAGQILFHQ